ncbi:hypothetical protein PROFUN_03287 [Planoprotostelium fungivorum]|uniref:DUF4455 domain-containing protein n=1 Tax=Planoprotostelium fungivorum TaxID=1890364 RepID=A0A2P6NWN7_9EUKA|nr:hypothetical protein PROFUN_03287 [Planoprotostelium fungivorum]
MRTARRTAGNADGDGPLEQRLMETAAIQRLDDDYGELHKKGSSNHSDQFLKKIERAQDDMRQSVMSAYETNRSNINLDLASKLKELLDRFQESLANSVKALTFALNEELSEENLPIIPLSSLDDIQHRVNDNIDQQRIMIRGLEMELDGIEDERRQRIEQEMKELYIQLSQIRHPHPVDCVTPLKEEIFQLNIAIIANSQNHHSIIHKLSTDHIRFAQRCLNTWTVKQKRCRQIQHQLLLTSMKEIIKEYQTSPYRSGIIQNTSLALSTVHEDLMEKFEDIPTYSPKCEGTWNMEEWIRGLNSALNEQETIHKKFLGELTALEDGMEANLRVSLSEFQEKTRQLAAEPPEVLNSIYEEFTADTNKRTTEARELIQQLSESLLIQCESLHPLVWLNGFCTDRTSKVQIDWMIKMVEGGVQLFTRHKHHLRSLRTEAETEYKRQTDLHLEALAQKKLQMQVMLGDIVQQHSDPSESSKDEVVTSAEQELLAFKEKMIQEVFEKYIHHVREEMPSYEKKVLSHFGVEAEIIPPPTANHPTRSHTPAWSKRALDPPSHSAVSPATPLVQDRPLPSESDNNLASRSVSNVSKETHGNDHAKVRKSGPVRPKNISTQLLYNAVMHNPNAIECHSGNRYTLKSKSPETIPNFLKPPPTEEMKPAATTVKTSARGARKDDKKRVVPSKSKTLENPAVEETVEQISVTNLLNLVKIPTLDGKPIIELKFIDDSTIERFRRVLVLNYLNDTEVETSDHTIEDEISWAFSIENELQSGSHDLEQTLRDMKKTFGQSMEDAAEERRLSLERHKKNFGSFRENLTLRLQKANLQVAKFVKEAEFHVKTFVDNQMVLRTQIEDIQKNLDTEMSTIKLKREEEARIAHDKRVEEDKAIAALQKMKRTTSKLKKMDSSVGTPVTPSTPQTVAPLQLPTESANSVTILPAAAVTVIAPRASVSTIVMHPLSQKISSIQRNLNLNKNAFLSQWQNRSRALIRDVQLAEKNIAEFSKQYTEKIHNESSLYSETDMESFHQESGEFVNDMLSKHKEITEQINQTISSMNAQAEKVSKKHEPPPPPEPTPAADPRKKGPKSGAKKKVATKQTS